MLAKNKCAVFFCENSFYKFLPLLDQQALILCGDSNTLNFMEARPRLKETVGR